MQERASLSGTIVSAVVTVIGFGIKLISDYRKRSQKTDAEVYNGIPNILNFSIDHSNLFLFQSFYVQSKLPLFSLRLR